MADISLSGSGTSISSLAFQVGDCIMRLKGFWDAVKDAPDDIKHLIEEIETLSLVLSDFETSEKPELNLGHEAMSRCFQNCKKAVGILERVVKEVEGEIKRRRRLGSVKAVLKKGEIEKFRERLIATQSMLMLSNNLYLVELQKRNQQAHHDWAKAHQHELQQLRVTVTQSTETILSSAGFQSHGQGLLTAAETDRLACGSKSLSANKAINKKEKSPFHSKRHMNLKARFRTPNWLFGVSHAIEIYESRANAGWAFNIQVYNVVPLESPIFNFAKKGDISGMKELFRTGQASPFDRNLYGRTLLDVAADHQRLEICRLLINEGADPNVSYSSSALEIASTSCYRSHSPNGIIDLVRLLSHDMELQDPIERAIEDNMHNQWTYYTGDAETLAWILQASNSSFQERSVEECVLFALNISYTAHLQDMAHIVRTVLKGREIDEQVCSIRDRDQYTLLHNAALSLGDLRSLYRGWWNEDHGGFEEIFSLITDLVNGGSNLHALTRFGCTPMLEIWGSFVSSYSLTHNLGLRNPSGDPIMPLKLWLKQLKKSGVDLEEYGKKEKRIFQDAEDRVREARVYTPVNPLFTQFPHKKLRLISFTYGSDPDDWKFWVEPVMENYLLHFWEMIDHPERAMSGAWEEEYSHDGTDYDSDY